MPSCRACQADLPADAKFCGFCGFGVEPIPAAHPEPQQRTEPTTGSIEKPILLTKAKRKSGPQLVVVDEGGQGEVLGEAKAAPTRSKRTTRAPDPGGRARAHVVEPGAPKPSKSTQRRAPAKQSKPAKTKQKRSKAPEGRVATPRAESAKPQPRRRRAPNRRKSPEVGASSDTQRTFQRFPLKIDVNLNSDHNFFTGFLENISDGGLFVSTHSPAAIGSRIELTFTIPGLKAIRALGQVRWVREYDENNPQIKPGMGLRFIELNEDVARQINRFISHRDPIFFDD